MNHKTLCRWCILSLLIISAKVVQADPLDFVKDHYSEKMKGPYFPDQELLLDIFGTYSLTEDGRYNDGAGGGAGLEFFLTKYLGVGGEAYWWDGDNVIHTFSGDVYLRYPIESIRFAPYILAGGSWHVDGFNQFSAHAGLGFDWRLGKGAGLFADGRFVLTERENDYGLFRFGVRFAVW